MRFGTYLLAFFLPPLYFLIRGRVLLGIFYGLLFLLSLVCLITIALAPVAIICWCFCMIHAMWNVRRQLVAEQTERLATKMAEKMTACAVTVPPPIRKV